MSIYEDKKQVVADTYEQTAGCLSAVGPCEIVCDACKTSARNYALTDVERLVSQAKRLLEYYGFEVLER